MSVVAKMTVTPPIGTFLKAEDVLREVVSILSDEEIWEFITISPDIYYFKHRDIPVKYSNTGWEDHDGHYIPEADEHLMFRYRVKRCINKGGYGQVLHCFDHKTGEDVAIKVLRHDSMLDADESKNELSVNIALKSAGGSPNIVRFDGYFNFRGHACFVFQFVRDGDLLALIPNAGLPMEDVRRFTVSILRGLLHMKNCGIIHSDLKPENILVANRAAGEVCITDFGLSLWEIDGDLQQSGTEGYVSPEVFLGHIVTSAADMWALGCIVAEMATGARFFIASQKDCLKEFIQVLGLPPQNRVHTSLEKIRPSGGNAIVDSSIIKPKETPLVIKLQHIKDGGFLDFVEKCFAWDPAKRITPKEALQHPWVTGSGVPTLPLPASLPLLVSPACPPVTHASLSQTSSSSLATFLSALETFSSRSVSFASLPVTSAYLSVTSSTSSLVSFLTARETNNSDLRTAPARGRFSRMKRRLRKMFHSLGQCCCCCWPKKRVYKSV